MSGLGPHLTAGSGVGVIGGSKDTWECFLKKLCNPKIMFFLFTSLYLLSLSPLFCFMLVMIWDP